MGRTEVRAFDPATDLDEAVAVLEVGGVVVHPTETVYGFGGSLDPAGVASVQHLKRRADGKPLLVLLPDMGTGWGLAWSDPALELARCFWPGSVTLVLRDPGGRFPPGVRSAEGTVAVRISSHPVASALVSAFGRPMTSTSANAPGEPPSRSGDAALAAALAQDPQSPVHLLDAGTLPSHTPSTIVDCTGDRPRVVREGGTPASRLRCVLPDIAHG